MSNTQKNPMQPLVFDSRDRIRFKKNSVVRYLLDHGGIDLNALAKIDFNLDDYTQFMQLIGYSVDGAAELEGFNRGVIKKADRKIEKMEDAKTKVQL